MQNEDKEILVIILAAVAAVVASIYFGFHIYAGTL